MRKFITLFSVLFFILTIPSFSFGGKETYKPTVIVDSSFWASEEDQKFIVEEILKPFAKRNASIAAFTAMDDDSILDRAEIQKITENQTTNLIIANVQYFDQWVSGEYADDLTADMANLSDRTISPGVNRFAVTYNAQHFIPLVSDVYLLCANVKALDFLPAETDVLSLTWEQFVKWTVAVAKSEGTGKVALAGAPGAGLIYQIAAVALAYGASFPDVSSDGAAKAWNVMLEMKNAYAPNVESYSDVAVPMKSGEAWITWASIDTVKSLYESEPERFIVAPVPRGPKGRGSVIDMYGIGIPADSPNRGLSLKLIEYFTSSSVSLEIARNTGVWIPPISELNDKLKDIARDKIIDKAITVFDSGALAFVPLEYVVAGNWKFVALAYDDIAAKLYSAGKVDREYLTEMQTKIDSYK